MPIHPKVKWADILVRFELVKQKISPIERRKESSDKYNTTIETVLKKTALITEVLIKIDKSWKKNLPIFVLQANFPTVRQLGQNLKT